ncbi:GTP cyclohydrolase [Hafnia alvei FB1]|uniref:GTP cyclohydrolase n=1 Tax=Hafnia alvei FB1 TaxID=1453496 RepID=A0A097R1A9_HAFAL|nr:YciI family protein [Hafnia alvei]AIU72502.1 GTP cyclohydrolase [Hafnia alvei FB1]
MFIVSLSYVKPLVDVEAYLNEHRQFLDACYSKGYFIASGTKEPRTGGVILAKGMTRTELETLIEEDPFHRAGVAQYEITEFMPVKHAQGFERYI